METPPELAEQKVEWRGAVDKQEVKVGRDKQEPQGIVGRQLCEPEVT